MDTENTGRRRKYVGVGGDDVPSLGVLEGDILRLLWDAGEPQSSVQVYEAMHFARRREQREMQSPSTIAVTLSRMVEKGLLKVERPRKSGKGYYAPTRTRAEIVSKVFDDVSHRLIGRPFGYVLAHLSGEGGKSDIEDVIEALRQVRDRYIASEKAEEKEKEKTAGAL